MSSSTDFEPTDRRGRQPSQIPAWLSLHYWQGRLFWLVVLIVPIWLLDGPLAATRLHDREIILFGDIRDVTRQFGEPVGIAWISVVLWFLDRSRRRPLVLALAAALIASALGAGTKLLVGRQRPKVSEGRTILEGPRWPGTMKPDPSFPSGHTVVAFAFACGLCRLYPQHRKLWLFLAAGCGASRALGEAHYLTDVVVGAWIGWEVARVLWGLPLVKKFVAAFDAKFPATEKLPGWNWQTCTPVLPAQGSCVGQGGG